MFSFFLKQIKKFQKNTNINKLFATRARQLEEWEVAGGLSEYILKPPSVEVPKTLFLYWAQGWDKAPTIANLCLEQWQKLNQDWEIKTLDKKTASDLSNLDLDYYESKFAPAHCADILRIRLLKKMGGVWADAAIWCQHPLNEFVQPLAVSGFFAFWRPAPDRIISNWFLVGGKNNYLVDSYDKLVQSFIEKRKTIDKYFFFHYLFEHLIGIDEKAAKIWQATPKISADASHQIGNAMLESPPPPAMLDFINSGAAFVHKLKTYKSLYQKPFPNSVLSSLIGVDDLSK